MEILVTTLIVAFTLYTLSRHFYNSLTADSSDSCGCGEDCGGCGGNCDHHDDKHTTDEAKKRPQLDKPAQFSFN